MATQNSTGIAAAFTSRSGELKNGVNHFILLLERIREINDSTHERLGSDFDGRDYRLVATEVEQAIRTHLVQASGGTKEGFLRAFCDFMSICADGCGVSRDWDPLLNTAAAFSFSGETA